jgi:glycosyltransferase involved in cell wall biosynthesis
VIDDLLVQNSEVVRFRGGYHAREMMDLIGQVDCIVIPSVWWENSPLTVQEAFMAGVPVICSNIGGLAEKVEHGVNGLHFAVGDHLHLLEQILVLAGDNELYAKLTNTRGSVKSASEMSDDMHRVYGKALGSVVLELKRSKGLRVES